MNIIHEEREEELELIIKELVSGRYIKHYRGCAVSQWTRAPQTKCNCGLEEVMSRARDLICDLE